MAPKVVCETVLSLVKHGFLNHVLGSALLQVNTFLLLLIIASGYYFKGKSQRATYTYPHEAKCSAHPD